MVMKKILFGLLALGVLLAMSGCQYSAKHFGGSYTANLPKGEKLVNATWKDDQLWYLTKPMTKDDKAETYKLKEDSTMGALQGTVTIKEHK